MVSVIDGILVTPNVGEFKIAFDREHYNVSKERLANCSTTNTFTGNTVGLELNELNFGQLSCHYDPVNTSPLWAIEVVKMVIDCIRSSRV